MAERLQDLGHLRAGITVRRATDVLWFYFGYTGFFTLIDKPLCCPLRRSRRPVDLLPGWEADALAAWPAERDGLRQEPDLFDGEAERSTDPELLTPAPWSSRSGRGR
ncbi:hypothetical protein ACFV2X_28735 [Streptomyces sp. NPDC059679]|uniref:hypothetical protein n=1 Tax=Streptomyces sp. NPDC059679 TaxID=3346903 RepID=UPI0036C063A6